MTAMQQPSPAASATWHDYWVVTKPRVTALAVFTSFIGMLLVDKGFPPATVVIGGCIGIALLAGASFAMNCLLEAAVDARMKRTDWRPSAQGRLSTAQIVIFALLLGVVGSAVLITTTNVLTWALTLATFFGYAFVYTLYLKPNTPQNIVIGGAAGAMPPVLGWAAVANDVSAPALLLFLIIFAWTPPHFWALALYRQEDYEKSGLPMLPVTHGREFTILHMLLYTWLLLAVSLLPVSIRMSGIAYGVVALGLGLRFVYLVWQLRREYSDARSKGVFRYSLTYLAALFAVLLADHYLSWL
ncbi:heme o synthase [Casimicrobium huifangae]|jgi:protoheme IX farnesyltransferase|uniref:heme o synthase n=1 Tax=Casimicrobium huifangae TaxID=2591109 RepID=UPI003784126C